jgi:hypothetical protein
MTFWTYLAYGLACWTLTSLVVTLILATIGYRWNKRREAAGRPTPAAVSCVQHKPYSLRRMSPLYTWMQFSPRCLHPGRFE